MDNDDIQSQIDLIADRLETIEDLLCSASLQQSKLAKTVDLGVLVAIAFCGCLGVLLISLRFEYGGFLFQVPLESIGHLLEAPIVASGVTAGVLWLLKSRSSK